MPRAQRQIVLDATPRPKRKTYPQNWSKYNEAQIEEATLFPLLLRALCDTLPTEPVPQRGRARFPLSEAIFAMAYKVFWRLSARRMSGMLDDAARKGLLKKPPHFNTVLKALSSPEATSALSRLIETSVQPVRGVECDIAVDASGFTTSNVSRWMDTKGERPLPMHQWIKAHLSFGVATCIVVGVKITRGASNDSPHLPELVRQSVKRLDGIRSVSADKGYSSVENLERIVEIGATPFVPFKSSATGASGGVWEEFYRQYMDHRPQFVARYHQRSNAESAFSMIKRRFGELLRSKNEVALVNEALCKILCHNICCLIRSTYETGIELDFSRSRAA